MIYMLKFQQFYLCRGNRFFFFFGTVKLKENKAISMRDINIPKRYSRLTNPLGGEKNLNLSNLNLLLADFARKASKSR